MDVHTLRPEVIALRGKSDAQLVIHRLPGGKRRGVGKALEHMAIAVEDLSLKPGEGECRQGGDAMRHHPFQHLVLDHQATAPPTQELRGGFIDVHLASNARQGDARGKTSNRAADHRNAPHVCSPES
jgi:hypothetical protein